jgi:hypothetical protein
MSEATRYFAPFNHPPVCPYFGTAKRGDPETDPSNQMSDDGETGLQLNGMDYEPKVAMRGLHIKGLQRSQVMIVGETGGVEIIQVNVTAEDVANGYYKEIPQVIKRIVFGSGTTATGMFPKF